MISSLPLSCRIAFPPIAKGCWMESICPVEVNNIIAMEHASAYRILSRSDEFCGKTVKT